MNLQQLIQEREEFEQALYDFFINDYLIIPESFWEPVKVCYQNVQSLQDIIIEENCVICTDKHTNFKKVHCCNQKICNGCCYEWFSISVKCPYCYQDLREFDLKNVILNN